MNAESLRIASYRLIVNLMNGFRKLGLLHVLRIWPPIFRSFLNSYARLVVLVVKADHANDPDQPIEIEIAPIEMGTLVKHVAAKFQSRLDDRQAGLTYPNRWPLARGYAPWVEQIWIIYITNALHFGGVPPKIRLGWEEFSNGQLSFWIKDNGRGLTETEISMVFRQFTRSERGPVEVHGLGLPIAARIAERLGGEVSVKSKIGKGSKFYFTLPKASYGQVSDLPQNS